jgi:hypothetical protein
MFTKILIANRSDQPRSSAATKSNCVVRAAHTGDLARMKESSHV